MIKTKIPASTGINMAKTLMMVDPMVSTVDMTGFPIPAVVVEDAALVPASTELIVAAVPPPAIIAKDHCIQLFTSVN